jgi:hypothetical protein
MLSENFALFFPEVNGNLFSKSQFIGLIFSPVEKINFLFSFLKKQENKINVSLSDLGSFI